MINNNYEIIYGGGGSGGGTGSGNIGTTVTVDVINFSQADVGDNPTVNLATGKLRYAFEDVNIGHGNGAIGISHVYASAGLADFADKYREYGNNWKLNLSQCIVQKGENYLYLDEQGEAHRFVPFDGNRYYDESDATKKLRVSYDKNTQELIGYTIADIFGNEMKFNSKGLIVSSDSVQNSLIKKEYVYNNDLLTTVYDKRSVNKDSGKVKTRIELSYDNGRLSAVTSYANFSKKVEGLKYEYDGSGNLAKVYKVAYNNVSKEVLTKQIFEFKYNGNSQLTEIIETEPKTAVKIDYTAYKVTKVTYGVLTENCIALEQNLYAGMAQCGTFNKREFVKKHSKSYGYHTNEDGISLTTDITNDDGITLTYFLNTKCQIVSSFEKAGQNRYKTLTKQGAKHTKTINDASKTQINGYSAVSSNESSLIVRLPSNFSLARNEAEKKYNYFQYSFWMKLDEECPLPQAMITYKFASHDQQQHKVKIDGLAVNAWQKVSLPIVVPNNGKGEPQVDDFVAASVSLLSENTFKNYNFEMIEIGFEPAPKITSYVRDEVYNAGYIYANINEATEAVFTVLKDGEYVYETKRINRDLYFTEKDIILSSINRTRYRDSKRRFDLICNDGTKRIPDIVYLELKIGDEKYEMDYIKIENEMQLGSSVSVEYKVTMNDLTVSSTGKNTDGITSQSITVLDKFNRVSSKLDEYGIKTIYKYDSYGNLETEQVVDPYDVVITTTRRHYDGEGRLLDTYDNMSGQRYEYNDRDQVSCVTEGNVVNGSLQPTSHSLHNKYGVYNDKTVKVREYDGDSQLACNTVTYQDGRIRTVTDGTVKYGVRYYPEQDKVEYTSIYKGEENVVQTDTITKGSNGEKNHISQFDSHQISTTVDAYDRVRQITRSKQADTTVFGYTYDENIKESKFASKPEKLTCGSRVTEYSYDYDGNLTGYLKKDGNKRTLEVKQISPDVTKYTYGNNDELFAVVERDREKTLNPRIKSVKYLTDWHSNYDNPAETPEFQMDYTRDLIGLPTQKKMLHKSGKGATIDYGYKTVNGISKQTSSRYNGKCWIGKDAGRNCISNFATDYEYDNLGQITQIKNNLSWQASYENLSGSWTNSQKYGYNALHQLVREEQNGVTKTYTYTPDGQLASIDGTKLLYDGIDKLLYQAGNTSYFYDSYGNRKTEITTGQKVKRYVYDCNLLTSTNDAEYKYTVDGVRREKVCNGVTTQYILDGNKILGEVQSGDGVVMTHVDGKRYIQYIYDTEGIAFTKIGDITYEMIKDVMGNVVMVVDQDSGQIACLYRYDALGNCTVLDNKGNVDTNKKSVGNTNPIRWKGFYYDVETGFYYANGSYYDPTVGQYLDAAPITTVIENAFTTHILDRHTPMCNNMLELAGSPATVYTETELCPDPTYDAYANAPWYIRVGIWYSKLHWGWKLGAAAILFVAAIGLNIASGGMGIEIISQVMLGVICGTLSWANGASLTTEGVTWQGIAKAALDSFLLTSAIVFIAAGVNYIRHLARSRYVYTKELAHDGIPDLGNKLDYVFGKASGSKHSIDRSRGMLQELERIGIRDNSMGREIVRENLIQAFYTTNNILGPGIVKGSIIKESFLSGPYGFLLVQSVWKKNVLQTVFLKR